MVGLRNVETAKNCMHLHIPYRCKVGQPCALQHNGTTNSETEISCKINEFCQEHLETASLEDEKSTTLRGRPSGSAL